MGWEWSSAGGNLVVQLVQEGAEEDEGVVLSSNLCQAPALAHGHAAIRSIVPQPCTAHHHMQACLFTHCTASNSTCRLELVSLSIGAFLLLCVILLICYILRSAQMTMTAYTLHAVQQKLTYGPLGWPGQPHPEARKPGSRKANLCATYMDQARTYAGDM